MSVYSYGFVDVRWYKTFAGAEKQQQEFGKLQKLNPDYAKRCFIVQVSEVERWHKSTGIDELERMMKL